jgi:hypothetical protein
MTAAIDQHIRRTGGRSDLGEMIQLAAVESLNAIAGRQLPDLFGDTEEKTRAALRDLDTATQFAVLARDFFSRLVRRQLDYFLSRELPQHVGINSRFQTIREHREFDVAIDMRCRGTSRIIKEFSGEWRQIALASRSLFSHQTNLPLIDKSGCDRLQSQTAVEPC